MADWLIWLMLPLAGYLIGSISGSLALGRWRGVDIRTMGSGNAGGTNALRTVGWQFALGVVVIDVGKGVAAAALLPMLAPLISADPAGFASLSAACGFAAIVGHVWPLYFRLRGGKGAGTAVGALAVTAPWCLAPLFLVWLVTLIGTGYVGLATVLAALSIVPSMWLLGPEPLPPGLGLYAIALAILLVFTHRTNLSRLASGSENRFEKARLLKKR